MNPSPALNVPDCLDDSELDIEHQVNQPIQPPPGATMTATTLATPANETKATTPAVEILCLKRTVNAFENWETSFRANPESFYTSEEVAAMEVATVSEARGIHFMALLRDQPKADAPPAPGEYWPGQGGRYICTLPALLGVPARHLIVGEGEAEDLIFGDYIDVPGATSHHDGQANTAALLATKEEHPAAKWAASYTADGHTDFFLPSRLDLLMAYIVAPQLFSKKDWYQSSTQLSRYYAFVQDFELGDSGWGNEDDELRVRAFRVIHLNA